MPQYGPTLFSSLQQAEAALAQNVGWTIFMNPTGGGHSAQAFGLPGGLDVDYVQGSPPMASADMVILGRPFIPVGRPLILPISPGQSSYPGPINYGCGIDWSYGEGGGAATFDWSVDSGNLAVIDQIVSPNQGNFQIADHYSGQLTVQIISVLDTKGSVTLFVDGIDKGQLSDGQQVPVSGEVISLTIETEFPTPAQDGFSVGYVLSQE